MALTWPFLFQASPVVFSIKKTMDNCGHDIGNFIIGETVSGFNFRNKNIKKGSKFRDSSILNFLLSKINGN